MSLYVLLHPFGVASGTAESEHTIPTEGSEIANIIDKGKGREIEHRRTLNRSPRIANPLATAESRLRVGDVSPHLGWRGREAR